MRPSKPMPSFIARTIPSDHLRRLEFLLGSFVGLETLYPPEGSPVQFQAHLNGEWEACDRFFKIDFYGEVPSLGRETFRGLITFSEARGAYRMWTFAASQEEPLHMVGNFDGPTLTFVSDPTPMVWGIQRLRYTLTALLDGGFELLGERWEPDGYAKYCTAVFRQDQGDQP